MQHAPDRIERLKAHDSFGAIISDLVGLVEHVQASISLLERAIAQEMTLGDIIVLDDVTPQYVQASAALNRCSANLSETVQFLLNAGACSCRLILSAAAD